MSKNGKAQFIDCYHIGILLMYRLQLGITLLVKLEVFFLIVELSPPIFTDMTDNSYFIILYIYTIM